MVYNIDQVHLLFSLKKYINYLMNLKKEYLHVSEIGWGIYLPT